jgi:hypothetical protein
MHLFVDRFFTLGTYPQGTHEAWVSIAKCLEIKGKAKKLLVVLG